MNILTGKLIVKSAPHILTPRTTQKIMLDVLIALCPAVIAATWLFGLRSLLLIVVSVASCLLFEFLFARLCKRPSNIGDLSAVVTGVLLALNIPVQLPLYILFFGAFVAIVISKQFFGGIGKNFSNPAITARVAMVISFAKPMSQWAVTGGGGFLDGMSSATPLALMKSGGLLDGVSSATAMKVSMPSISSLFFGTHLGSLGETCALALLLGGVYLIVRRVITLAIPVSFLGTVAVIALLAGKNPLQHLLTGGVLLGAIFMATDYVTSPTTEKGKCIYGFGCGFITMAIRLFATFPEGVSFAILLMNLLSPHLDRITRTKPFGGETNASK